MTKRIYRILVKNGWSPMLVKELNAWGVSSEKYQMGGDTIVTTDTNIVDIATEMFIDNSQLVSISSMKA